jgi:hypothetical protein
VLWGYLWDMTASEIPVERDSDLIERDGIARVIYVLPAAVAIGRDESDGEVESTVELRDGA